MKQSKWGILILLTISFMGCGSSDDGGGEAGAGTDVADTVRRERLSFQADTSVLDLTYTDTTFNFAIGLPSMVEEMPIISDETTASQPVNVYFGIFDPGTQLTFLVGKPGEPVTKWPDRIEQHLKEGTYYKAPSRVEGLYLEKPVTQLTYEAANGSELVEQFVFTDWMGGQFSLAFSMPPAAEDDARKRLQAMMASLTSRSRNPA